MTQFNTPIWLSDWTLEDSKGKNYFIRDIVVKGKTKGDIFLNKKIVNKVVRKLIGTRKKHSIKPINLKLKSQHGFGIDE